MSAAPEVTLQRMEEGLFTWELTDEHKAAYLALVAEGIDPGEAAHQIGTTGTRFRSLRSPGSQYYDPDFASEFEHVLQSPAREQARRELIDEFIWSAAHRGARWAIEKLAVTYHPDYAYLRHANLRIDHELRVVQSLLPGLTDEELQRVIEQKEAEAEQRALMPG